MIRNIFLLCFLFAATYMGAQEIGPPWYNVMYVNADEPGAQFRFSFVHLTDTHIGEGAGDYGSPGILDEPPEGDIGYPAERLRRFVEYINEVHTEEGIAFVVVSGDLTDSGERSEFLKFKEIMGDLEIPYVPLIGNHDVWPYTNDTIGNRPNGDSLINVLFEDIFTEAADFFDTWDNGTRLEYAWNPEAGVNNYLQNYHASYRGAHFLFMDFDPRYPAPMDLPGIGPEAEIMDFEGGTWPWVRSKISSLSDAGRHSIFLVSHHPPLKEFWGFHYAFTIDEKETMMDFLFPFQNQLAIWLAGHIHRNKTYMTTTVSVQPYQVVLCAETDANKELEQGAFRLIRFYESGIPTAVEDAMLLQGLDVYPNPGSGLYKLFLKDNHDKYLDARVFDNTGKLVYRESLEMIGTSYLFELDLRDLPRGMYHLRLRNSEGMSSVNLIVQ